MRPLLAIIGLILACIALAAYTSRLRPHTSEEASRLPETGSPEKAGFGITDPKTLLPYDKVTAGALHATLEIEGRGTMILELYPKAAPQTVKHFQDLCARGFYNGILFHRVEAGFVAQAGDPDSKSMDPSNLRGLTSVQVGERFNLGSNGSGETVPLEAKLPHKTDSIGLARATNTDSGDSQFFINLSDNDAALDGKYCAFGRIIKGAEIASKIAIGDRITRLSIQ